MDIEREREQRTEKKKQMVCCLVFCWFDLILVWFFFAFAFCHFQSHVKTSVRFFIITSLCFLCVTLFCDLVSYGLTSWLGNTRNKAIYSCFFFVKRIKFIPTWVNRRRKEGNSILLLKIKGNYVWRWWFGYWFLISCWSLDVWPVMGKKLHN